MTSGIYKIGNNVSNKLYIGASTCIEERWKAHVRRGKRNPKEIYDYHSIIHEAMYQLGADKFFIECIEGVPGDKSSTHNKLLLEIERQWINKLGSTHPHGYNAPTGRLLTDEQAAIIRFDAYGLTRKQYGEIFDNLARL